MTEGQRLGLVWLVTWAAIWLSWLAWYKSLPWRRRRRTYRSAQYVSEHWRRQHGYWKGGDPP